MRALRVGAAYFVNADSIEIIQPWPSRQAARLRKQAEEARCYYDATGGKRILSLLILGSGWVIASPFHPAALIQRPVIQAPTRTSTRRDAEEVEPARAEPVVVLNGAGGDHGDGDDESAATVGAAGPDSGVERRNPLSRLIRRRQPPEQNK